MTDKTNFNLHAFSREENKDISYNFHTNNNHFEIILFENGKGTILIDFLEHNISENILYFLNPKTVYSISTITFSKCWVLTMELKYLGLFSNNYQILFCPFSTLPYSKLSDIQYNHLDLILTNVKDELESNNIKRTEAINNLINLLFIQIERVRTVELNPSSKTNNLTTFYSLLEENFISIKDVTDYASKLNITSKQLNRLCLTYLKKNASTLIEERVNLEAMRLLLNSKLTVKEVAFTLGFDDPSYFNRYFKRINNTTPNNFKALMSDKYHKRVV